MIEREIRMSVCLYDDTDHWYWMAEITDGGFEEGTVDTEYRAWVAAKDAAQRLIPDVKNAGRQG